MMTVYHTSKSYSFECCKKGKEALRTAWNEIAMAESWHKVPVISKGEITPLIGFYRPFIMADNL